MRISLVVEHVCGGSIPSYATKDVSKLKNVLMKKYIRFDIQERMFSSNALVGIYLTQSGKERAEYLLSFSNLPKQEADLQINELKNQYNQNV